MLIVSVCMGSLLSCNKIHTHTQLEDKRYESPDRMGSIKVIYKLARCRLIIQAIGVDPLILNDAYKEWSIHNPSNTFNPWTPSLEWTNFYHRPHNCQRLPSEFWRRRACGEEHVAGGNASPEAVLNGTVNNKNYRLYIKHLAYIIIELGTPIWSRGSCFTKGLNKKPRIHLHGPYN